MRRQIFVSLFVSIVLRDIVKVVSPDNESPLHLGADHPTSQDSSPDADISRERALLVNILTTDCFGGGLEAKADILVPALGNSEFSANSRFRILEKVLLLERLLNLFGHGT